MHLRGHIFLVTNLTLPKGAEGVQEAKAPAGGLADEAAPRGSGAEPLSAGGFSAAPRLSKERFLCLFQIKLYMIIYWIESFWNFDGFTNFRNWTISEIFAILQFGKLTNLSIFLTFANFQNRNVWSSKILLLKILTLIPENLKFEKLANFPIWYCYVLASIVFRR